MLTVIIGSNCQKGSILEKFVAEEQCIFNISLIRHGFLKKWGVGLRVEIVSNENQ